MTRYLDRMEKAGLIVRTRSREDARRIQLALTPKGVRVLRSVAAPHGWLAERPRRASRPSEQRAVDEAIEPLARSWRRTTGDRGAARAQLAHVLEPAPAPELPPLLHRPDRLGDRARGCRTRRCRG
jgi:DNA-binding MarR family transcriptional regulator